MSEIHRPGTGAIFGIVTEEGVVKDGSPVYLYDMRRYEGLGKARLLARRLTRPDGGFEFGALNPAYGDYLVMASDEDGAEPKNALVEDRVQPIDAHSGAGHLEEWYVQAVRNGAMAGFVGWPVYQDGSGPVVPWSLAARVAQNETYPINWVPSAEPPAEYPQMAALEHNPTGWTIIPGRQAGDERSTSMEVLLDVDSLTTQSGDSWVVAIQGREDYLFGAPEFNQLIAHEATSGHYSTALRIGLVLTPTQQIEVRASTSEIDGAWTRNTDLLATFDLSALSGVRHIVATFASGSSVAMYVDGALFGTQSTSESVPNFDTGTPGPTIMGFTECGDYNTSGVCGFGHNNERDYQISMAVYYNRVLTSNEVDRLYRSLYDNNLISPFSGYAREVMKDKPHVYWRMDDYDPDNRPSLASSVHRTDANTGEGYYRARLEVIGQDYLVSPHGSSPIAGRNAPVVNATDDVYFRAEFAPTWGWLLRDQGSCSFWVKFDDAPGASDEQLVEFFVSDSTSSRYFRVYRAPDDQLRIEIWEGGQPNTYGVGNYTIPQGQWQQICIAIDKTGVDDPGNGLMHVYVGDEATAPALVQTLFVALTPLYTTAALAGESMGMERMRVQSMVNFTGSMCELALFPEMLPLERFIAHWDEKDVV